MPEPFDVRLEHTAVLERAASLDTVFTGPQGLPSPAALAISASDTCRRAVVPPKGTVTAVRVAATVAPVTDAGPRR